jgi:hypothetical protein
VPDLPIGPDRRPPYRRRDMLRAGAAASPPWWKYESENPPGHTVGSVTYDEVTYTVKMPNGRRVTLLGGEVEGFVIREALDRPDGFERVAYRRGLLPEDNK